MVTGKPKLQAKITSDSKAEEVDLEQLANQEFADQDRKRKAVLNPIIRQGNLAQRETGRETQLSGEDE